MRLGLLLLYAMAVTLPFPAYGYAYSHQYIVSPSLIFGVFYALTLLIVRGIGPMHMAAAGMLLLFTLTAMPRYEPSTYILSICALGVAIAPLTVTALSKKALEVLLSGFMLGLYLTLAIIFIEVGAQTVGIEIVGEYLRLVFVHSASGEFIYYDRPRAGFFEPSHLAIYLCFAFVILDCYDNKNGRSLSLKMVIVIGLLVVGSLSGIVVFAIYVVFKYFELIVTRSRRRVFIVHAIPYGIIVMCVVGFFAAYYHEILAKFIEVYYFRIGYAITSFWQGDLVGSEGSRVNAITALPAYWSQKGFSGFMFGTGYSNYQEWLVSTYGHLGSWSTFARGQIDNLFVAVFLSTGLVGLIAYVYFILLAFRGAALHRTVSISIFIVCIQFAYGYLVHYLYWYLLFVLASVLRRNMRTYPSES